MRKLIKSALLMAAIAFSGAVMADVEPYVGVDAQYRSVLLRDLFKNHFTQKAPGIGGYVGARWDFIGVEAGTHMFKRKHRKEKVTGHGFHLSLVGYLEGTEWLDFIGSLGVSHLTHKHDTPWYWIRMKGCAPRLGLGFEVKLTDFVAWRTMALWESKVTLRNVSTVPRGTMGASTGLKLSF